MFCSSHQEVFYIFVECIARYLVFMSLLKYYFLLNCNHSGKGIHISLWLQFVFPWWLMRSSTFSCVLAICISSIVKCLFTFLSPFRGICILNIFFYLPSSSLPSYSITGVLININVNQQLHSVFNCNKSISSSAGQKHVCVEFTTRLDVYLLCFTDNFIDFSRATLMTWFLTCTITFRTCPPSYESTAVSPTFQPSERNVMASPCSPDIQNLANRDMSFSFSLHRSYIIAPRNYYNSLDITCLCIPMPFLSSFLCLECPFLLDLYLLFKIQLKLSSPLHAFPSLNSLSAVSLMLLLLISSSQRSNNSTLRHFSPHSHPSPTVQDADFQSRDAIGQHLLTQRLFSPVSFPGQPHPEELIPH